MENHKYIIITVNLPEMKNIHKSISVTEIQGMTETLEYL